MRSYKFRKIGQLTPRQVAHIVKQAIGFYMSERASKAGSTPSKARSLAQRKNMAKARQVKNRFVKGNYLAI